MFLLMLLAPLVPVPRERVDTGNYLWNFTFADRSQLRSHVRGAGHGEVVAEVILPVTDCVMFAAVNALYEPI